VAKLISTDQLGTRIETDPPQRIVSLVPSQTELLFDLGLDDRVVGITKFCVHPAHWQRTKAIVGGTKNFHFDTIARLQPDIIIGNKEENYESGILELRKRYPVWLSDVVTFSDALAMIQSVALLTQTSDKGDEIISSIESAFSELKPIRPRRTLYIMWRDPWMAAANGTFIHAMLSRAGLVNVLGHAQRYPTLTILDIQRLDPELILLSSEPFPFNEKHIAETQEILPRSKVLLADGEMFSWYGSRLRDAPVYFNSLLAGL
jgi:ABC-type Fe3+-hydroxamate transport system substrate-binding protein